jgi:ADP-heptose:LPS heptosyltransferase
MFSEQNFNIGVVWQGSVGSSVDSGRSFSVGQFEGLARIPGVRLFSLQKNESDASAALSTMNFEIRDFGDQLDAEGMFLDTSAIIEQLDLVISSDTSVAHLAGALGARIFVALKFMPDWRWLLEREDSPWYPSMRLFRQTVRDDWGSVFPSIEREVRVLVAQKLSADAISD